LQLIPAAASRTAPDVVADMKGAVDNLKPYRAQYGGGSLRAAIEWFCNATVAEFENRTVKELIASGEIEPVLMYLSSGSAGSSG
jgi:hypothetical protein